MIVQERLLKNKFYVLTDAKLRVSSQKAITLKANAEEI
jgi:hypothetical protein